MTPWKFSFWTFCTANGEIYCYKMLLRYVSVFWLRQSCRRLRRLRCGLLSVGILLRPGVTRSMLGVFLPANKRIQPHARDPRYGRHCPHTGLFAFSLTDPLDRSER